MQSRCHRFLGSGRFDSAPTSPGAEAASVSVTATDVDRDSRSKTKSTRVTIGPDGTIHQILDKEAGRNVFADRGNQLWAYVDKPYAWDAWDIDETYARDGEEIVDIQRLGIVETGPIRAAIRVERRWRNSTIAQTISSGTTPNGLTLCPRSTGTNARFCLKRTCRWRSARIRPPSKRCTARCIDRHIATARGTPSRFEGCGHRWGDISEPGYGVALLNDGKYGYEALGNDLMLSLLRGPLYPDPLADEGEHRFTYSVFPHTETGRRAA